MYHYRVITNWAEEIVNPPIVEIETAELLFDAFARAKAKREELDLDVGCDDPNPNIDGRLE